MQTVTEHDLELADGRRLRYYDTGDASGTPGGLAVMWHHGSPNIGEPPAPLFAAAAGLGLRWIGYDRPGYGGSSARTGRDIASAAADAAAVADALGIGRFAVYGHSGGGAHALACAALLPERISAAVSVSGLAPYDAAGLDFFAGFAPSGAAELRAAAEGRSALERFLEESEFDPEIFTPGDHKAFEGDWGWFNGIVQRAMAHGPGGFVDDDLAGVAPWGFEPGAIRVPALVVHGHDDRMVPRQHGEWLGAHIPGARLRVVPGAGHISVLEDAGAAALDWVKGAAG